MSRKAKPEYFFRVEVTVAAAIAKGNRVLGDNVVDVTFGFSMSASEPPGVLSDARINALLAHNVSPVCAAVQTVLKQMGFAALGTIDEPMTEHSSPTGEFGKSSPVAVISVPSVGTGRTQ